MANTPFGAGSTLVNIEAGSAAEQRAITDMPALTGGFDVTPVDAHVGFAAVAAAQTDAQISSAIGDFLRGVWIIPAAASPGAVTFKDGDGGTDITLFAGGANSVEFFHPFYMALGIAALDESWYFTTGADVSIIAVGTFTAVPAP